MANVFLDPYGITCPKYHSRLVSSIRLMSCCIIYRLFFFLRTRLRPIVGQPGSSSIIIVELQDAQGRTKGLKVVVGDVRGVFPGSLTGILVDSVCRWHHWCPSRRGTHRTATRTLIPSRLLISFIESSSQRLKRIVGIVVKY